MWALQRPLQSAMRPLQQRVAHLLCTSWCALIPAQLQFQKLLLLYGQIRLPAVPLWAKMTCTLQSGVIYLLDPAPQNPAPPLGQQVHGCGLQMSKMFDVWRRCRRITACKDMCLCFSVCLCGWVCESSQKFGQNSFHTAICFASMTSSAHKLHHILFHLGI